MSYMSKGQDMIGTTIDQYRILEEIGRGGMGVVYLAEHVVLEKKYAVKALSQVLTADVRFRERFFKEAKSQARLDHHNITRIENFIEKGGNFHLVMEYVPGQSLEELIQARGIFQEKEALNIFKQVLHGLEHAHSMGVVHRDIKPSNIKITPSGEVKILDFGIALMVGDKRITRTGTTIGTPEYMSPEQIRKPKEMDHRSDIYSAGIVLYEMLVGEVPFHGESDADTGDESSDYNIKEQHVREAPPDPRSRNPRLSVTMAQIMLKALEKEPAARYATCGEFLNIIEAYESGEKEDSLPDAAESVKRAKLVEEKRPVVREKVAGRKSGKGGILVLLTGVFAILAVGLIWLMEQQRKEATDLQRADKLYQVEDIAWQEAMAENTKESYRNYLSRWPVGKYWEEASTRIAAAFPKEKIILYRIKLNGKYGFIDKKGKLVISPQLDYTYSFSEGLAAVRMNNKWGYIDSKGNIVIEPKFDYAGPFQENLAIVIIGGEQLLTKNNYWVHKGGKYGFIDKNGNLVITPRFENAYSFSEGLACVASEGEWKSWQNSEGFYYEGGQWGFIDKAGRIVINQNYSYAMSFSEGLAPVKGNGESGFIDKTGRTVISISQYSNFYGFHEGRATVIINNKYGYIDKTGKEVITPQFKWTSFFSEGLAGVELNGKWGYINRYGSFTITPQFEYARDFRESLAGVKLNNKYGFIDRTGMIVITPKFGNIGYFSQGIASVDIDGKEGYIDKIGRYCWEPTK